MASQVEAQIQEPGFQKWQTDLTAGAIGEPAPNRGASIPDTQAIGDERESITAWRQRNNIDTSKQIRLVKLSHMRYQHPDLDLTITFMADFGMHVVKRTDERIWFRGYGPDQYVYYAQKGPKQFLGGAFEVETYADLEKASHLAGAGSIQKLDDSPGGGYMLSLTDPEGFPVNLLYGQQPAEAGHLPEKLLVNDPADKPRKRVFQRFQPGPAAVHKLGHYGLCVQQFDTQVEWYTRNFNLVPTDYLYVPDDDDNDNDADGKTPKSKKTKNVAMFAHIDRGQSLVDHHTFFMAANPTASHVHHCSFEVHDFDTQQLGHKWLAAKGYGSVWGVGRHVLGSQIFDYWWDTTGFMVEHYADGDLVNEETPVGYGPAGHESLAVWGPEVPKTFLD